MDSTIDYGYVLGEFFYNTTFHISIKMTPFISLYGYEAPTFADLMFGDCREQKSKYWLQENQGIFKGTERQTVDGTKPTKGVCR